MTPRRSTRIASERLGPEGDVEYVPPAETTTICTKKGQLATNSTPGGRKKVKIRTGNTTSRIRGNDFEKENASLGEKEIQTTSKLAEKRSLQVSNATDPAKKRLKYDEGVQNLAQTPEDGCHRLRRRLLRSTEKIVDLELNAQDKEDEVAELKDENSMLSKLVGNLEAEVARLTDSNNLIQDKCKELEEHRDEIQQNAIQALDDAKKHHTNELSTISMDAIDKKWRHLIYCIHDLVVQNLTAEPAQDGDLQTRRAVGRLIRAVRERPYLQTSLIERYIWRYIYRSVFQADSALWGGASGLTLTTICGDPRVQTGLSVTKVMKYRAAETLISRFGVNERQRLMHIEDIYEGLASFQSNLVTTEVREGVVLAFDSAVNIMKMFMKSQDIYEFGTCFEDSNSRQVAYDKENMNISACLMPGSPHRNQPERFEVLLVHNPPLFIISMTEGEYFGRKELVCRANVTVRKEEVSDDDTEKGSGGLEDKISDEVSIIVS
ncbi:hypothetical protein H634G_01100 [Metarhizium anisopliae BRIP 53293]|uniref:Uncharacterized protein n=1 Tax=Metarhizium anisopliae BRIP 53293 TaxID=1291518 RepID=A0A0D9P9M9_METAN|nr:hypothetical protein H634G_01100 [Metarhizium anisopliae BRIP 53293]KJK93041.1 hypothetical protein H633G_03103 [Metarhizium anisopliae BRIP 53284]